MVMNIYGLIDTLAQIYFYMIFGYVLLSWFPNARESFIGELLAKLVEPYLSAFRRFIPPIGPLDISPIVAMGVFWLVVAGLKVVVGYIVGIF
ncbi:YggT family protein [Paenibacillus chitinolyticus]|uniref:YggT family protein n=2 Tax=Paenibacillus chitinolyticus TaxID=79263 RepID=A0A410X142_9BACL|nr:YggT family protein [Paenibacillus chitinolyticus]GKS12536.1 membrane protein [Paenibacillus chitinolyticus]SEF52053.1 YggT family protein [Paenibacillus sp. UNC499MF]